MFNMMTATKLKLLMRALIAIAVIGTFAVLHQTLAQSSTNVQNNLKKEPDQLRATINFENVSFSQAFTVYSQLCKAQKIKVDADESVKRVQTPVNLKCSNVTTSEAIQLMEQVFTNRCGIEVLHPSTNEVVLQLKAQPRYFPSFAPSH
jgi:hypothetical protein